MGRQDAGPPGGVGALDATLLEVLMGVALEAGKAALRPQREAKRRAAAPPPPPAGSPAERARRLVIEAISGIAPRTALVVAGDPLFQDPPADPVADVFLASALEGADRSEPSLDSLGDATIDIAVLRDGQPAMGVVYAPGREKLWAGHPGAAYVFDVPRFTTSPPRPIRIREAPTGGIAAISTLSVDPLLAAFDPVDVRSAGLAVALCLVAEGAADVASIPARTPAWSAAAADAILRAAGGRTLRLDGSPLSYRWIEGAGPEAFALPAAAALGAIGLPASVLA
jgi:3'(2'), 5'-bisphosphate nucleotidase